MAHPVRHSLLTRQLKIAFGEDPPPTGLEPLLVIVGEAYHQDDDDRLMLERSLDLSSEELFEAN